ncbi:IS110 family transposase [Flavobacteriaceae bacterium SZ-1-7]|uniref:IS110 family transposase n=1 Tax=Tamlana sedimenti TaxID=3134126 RepID=UPI003129FEEF
MQNPPIFIGIDISKSTLDICLLEKEEARHYQIQNQTASIQSFFKKNMLKKSLICFENTGKYGWELINALSKLKLNFYQVNAFHLKRSIGLVRGKNDVVDAFRIAQFIQKNHKETPAYIPKGKEAERIQILLSKRSLLVRQRAQHKSLKKENRLLKSLGLPALDKQTDKIIALLNRQILEIENIIDKIIEQNEELLKNHNIVTSIPGVGKIVSWNMIVKTNGYSKISDPRKFACYAGIAPFSQKSGTSINKKARVSHLADKTIKKLLHMAAMRAIQLDNDLRNYYIRKVEQGKNKMAVINAIRNKIVHRMFAMVKNQKLYDFNLQMS